MALQTYLLFFLRDVIDRNLEAGVLKDDPFHDKGASVFVDCDGHTLFVFSPRALLLVLVDEMNDVFQFADGEYFLCRFQVRVRNQVTVLSKEVVDQNLFFVFGEYAQPFMRNLKMGNQFLAFDVECLFRFVQTLVYLDDVLRNLSQLIMRKSGLHRHLYRFVTVCTHGKLAELADRGSQFVGEFVEDHHEQQRHNDRKP